MTEIESSILQHIFSYGTPGVIIVALIYYLLKREKHFDARIDKKDELVLSTMREKDKEISTLTQSFQDYMKESHVILGQISMNETRQTQILDELKDELRAQPNEVTLRVMAEIGKLGKRP